MSSANQQKTPIAASLERFAARKIRGALTTLGQSLPATVVSRNGGIVTVKFALTSPYTLPNVTVPMWGSEYVRLPIQAGCPGFVMSADAYLGGMSGLGGGTADITPRGNLSMLVWTPIGNKNWSTSEDDNALVLYGPDGGILRTTDKTSIVSVTAAGTVITVPAGTSVQIVNLPSAPTGGTGSLWRSGNDVKVV